MQTKTIVAAGACLLIIGIAAPWAADGMRSLSNEVAESSAAQLRAKGCRDLGVVDVTASSIGFDPIGPGPVKASPKQARVHRFVCGDGSQHDLPAS